MKLVRWTRFSWDLTCLAPVYPAIDSHYRIRQATAEDEKAVRAVVFSSFTLDQNWNFLLREIRDQLNTSLDSVFHDRLDRAQQRRRQEAGDNSERFCLVATHGSRVIATSALSANRDAENHLLTGPCILMEYRNRGLATALLAHSLMALREVNITTAYGLTKQDSPTQQFVYTKFGSVSAPYEHEHLAAS